MIPGMAVGGVFQDASPGADGGQGGSEATLVVAEFVLVRFAGGAVPETAPAFTRWVGDHRMRALVQARVSGDGPRVYARLVGVAAGIADEEGGDHVGR